MNDVFPAGRPGPVLATVFLGANDAASPEFNPRQHVPLSEYTANLRLIVRHIQSLGTPAAPVQVLLIAPPPIDIEAVQATFPVKYPLAETRDRTLELSGVYARACVDLAAEMGCVTVRARGGCWMTVVARELARSLACGTGLVDSACGLG